jgi:uncharacterized hydantoinase/oxoprolinase family protein
MTRPGMTKRTEREAIARLARIIGEDRPELEKLRDLVDKYKWQVIDTCKRAEAAESRASALEALWVEAVQIIQCIPNKTEHERFVLAKLKARVS